MRLRWWKEEDRVGVTGTVLLNKQDINGKLICQTFMDYGDFHVFAQMVLKATPYQSDIPLSFALLLAK